MFIITPLFLDIYIRHFLYISGDFYDGETVENCPAACNQIDFKFGFPSIYPIKHNSSSQLTMYFGTSVSIRESRIAYDKSSLFAEIGGYTGLLLGFSFFDFAKLFSFFSERVQNFSRKSNK